MGCVVSTASDPAVLYSEEELILKQQAQEAKRREDAVCTYIGHLILHDEKFRGLLAIMLDDERDLEERTAMMETVRERLESYLVPLIGNPYLKLFRDKLPQAQVDEFLELEMDAPRLAEALCRVMKANPHLIFFKGAELGDRARKDDVEELFIRLWDKVPLDELTEEHSWNLREKEREKKQPKVEEPPVPKLKGNQQHKDHLKQNMTEVQRAALALEQLAGDAKVTEEERKATRKRFKEDQKRRKRQLQERNIAKAEPTPEELEGAELEAAQKAAEPSTPRRGDKTIEEFETEMASYLANKNDASLMTTDLYFQRSFWKGKPNTSPAEPEPEPEPEPGPMNKSQRRWRGAAARVIVAEREFHGQHSRGNRHGNHAKSSSSDTSRRKSAAADSVAVTVPNSEDPGNKAKGMGKEPRVLGLDENLNAVWSKGRGTTRLTFAVDEPVNTKRYNIKGSSNGKTNDGSTAANMDPVVAARKKDPKAHWFTHEFGEGALGLSCAQLGQDQVVVRAVEPGSLAASCGILAGTMLRAVQGMECAGLTLGQVVNRMIEIGRPVKLTFEAVDDTPGDGAAQEAVPSSRLSSKAKSVKSDGSGDAEDTATLKRRAEAAAKAIEESAAASKKAGKASVFREQKEAARLAEEAKAKKEADKKAHREKMKERKQRKEEENKLTPEELLVLASEYRTNDDFSAVGRLWTAVKNVEGCPAYSKFKRWVIEQQALEETDRVAEKEMEKAKQELTEALMVLQRNASVKTLGGKKQKAAVEAVMAAERKVLALEAKDKELYKPPPGFEG